MRSAINLGIYRDDSTEIRVDVSCPTGNCTFPQVYHSTGYYSECTDISDQIQVHARNKEGEDDGAFLFYAHETEKWEREGVNLTSLNFTLPGTDVWANPGVELTTGWPWGGDSFYALMSYSAIRLGVEACNDTDLWRCKGYGAATCRVRQAIYTYTGEVHDAVFSEKITNIMPIPFGDNWVDTKGQETAVWSVIDKSCLTPSEKDFLLESGYLIQEDNTNWIPYDLSIPASEAFNNSHNAPNNAPNNNNNNNTQTQTRIRPECTYQISRHELSSLNFFFQVIFPADYGIAAPNPASPSIGHVFYHNGDMSIRTIQKTMSGMAEVMTTSQRNKSPSTIRNETRNYGVKGKVFRTDTCVRIGWLWLSFPAVLTALTVLFMGVLGFGWVCVGSEDGEERLVRHDYKTGVVPLLVHGFEPRWGWRGKRVFTDGSSSDEERSIGSKMGGSTTTLGSEVSADGIRMETTKWYGRRGENVLVRFEGKGDEWRLVEVQEDGRKGGIGC